MKEMKKSLKYVLISISLVVVLAIGAVATILLTRKPNQSRDENFTPEQNILVDKISKNNDKKKSEGEKTFVQAGAVVDENGTEFDEEKIYAFYDGYFVALDEDGNKIFYLQENNQSVNVFASLKQKGLISSSVIKLSAIKTNGKYLLYSYEYSENEKTFKVYEVANLENLTIENKLSFDLNGDSLYLNEEKVKNISVNLFDNYFELIYSKQQSQIAYADENEEPIVIQKDIFVYGTNLAQSTVEYNSFDAIELEEQKSFNNEVIIKTFDGGAYFIYKSSDNDRDTFKTFIYNFDGEYEVNYFAVDSGVFIEKKLIVGIDDFMNDDKVFFEGGRYCKYTYEYFDKKLGNVSDYVLESGVLKASFDSVDDYLVVFKQAKNYISINEIGIMTYYDAEGMAVISYEASSINSKILYSNNGRFVTNDGIFACDKQVYADDVFYFKTNEYEMKIVSDVIDSNYFVIEDLTNGGQYIIGIDGRIMFDGIYVSIIDFGNGYFLTTKDGKRHLCNPSENLYLELKGYSGFYDVYLPQFGFYLIENETNKTYSLFNYKNECIESDVKLDVTARENFVSIVASKENYEKLYVLKTNKNFGDEKINYYSGKTEIEDEVIEQEALEQSAVCEECGKNHSTIESYDGTEPECDHSYTLPDDEENPYTKGTLSISGTDSTFTTTVVPISQTATNSSGPSLSYVATDKELITYTYPTTVILEVPDYSGYSICKEIVSTVSCACGSSGDSYTSGWKLDGEYSGGDTYEIKISDSGGYLYMTGAPDGFTLKEDYAVSSSVGTAGTITFSFSYSNSYWAETLPDDLSKTATITVGEETATYQPQERITYTTTLHYDTPYYGSESFTTSTTEHQYCFFTGIMIAREESIDPDFYNHRISAKKTIYFYQIKSSLSSREYRVKGTIWACFHDIYSGPTIFFVPDNFSDIGDSISEGSIVFTLMNGDNIGIEIASDRPKLTTLKLLNNLGNLKAGSMNISNSDLYWSLNHYVKNDANPYCIISDWYDAHFYGSLISKNKQVPGESIEKQHDCDYEEESSSSDCLSITTRYFDLSDVEDYGVDGVSETSGKEALENHFSYVEPTADHYIFRGWQLASEYELDNSLTNYGGDDSSESTYINHQHPTKAYKHYDGYALNVSFGDHYRSKNLYPIWEGVELTIRYLVDKTYSGGQLKTDLTNNANVIKSVDLKSETVPATESNQVQFNMNAPAIIDTTNSNAFYMEYVAKLKNPKPDDLLNKVSEEALKYNKAGCLVSENYILSGWQLAQPNIEDSYIWGNYIPNNLDQSSSVPDDYITGQLNRVSNALEKINNVSSNVYVLPSMKAKDYNFDSKSEVKSDLVSIKNTITDEDNITLGNSLGQTVYGKANKNSISIVKNAYWDTVAKKYYLVVSIKIQAYGNESLSGVLFNYPEMYYAFTEITISDYYGSGNNDNNKKDKYTFTYNYFGVPSTDGSIDFGYSTDTSKNWTKAYEGAVTGANAGESIQIVTKDNVGTLFKNAGGGAYSGLYSNAANLVLRLELNGSNDSSYSGSNIYSQLGEISFKDLQPVYEAFHDLDYQINKKDNTSDGDKTYHDSVNEYNVGGSAGGSYGYGFPYNDGGTPKNDGDIAGLKIEKDTGVNDSDYSVIYDEAGQIIVYRLDVKYSDEYCPNNSGNSLTYNVAQSKLSNQSNQYLNFEGTIYNVDSRRLGANAYKKLTYGNNSWSATNGNYQYLYRYHIPCRNHDLYDGYMYSYDTVTWGIELSSEILAQAKVVSFTETNIENPLLPGSYLSMVNMGENEDEKLTINAKSYSTTSFVNNSKMLVIKPKHVDMTYSSSVNSVINKKGIIPTTYISKLKIGTQTFDLCNYLDQHEQFSEDNKWLKDSYGNISLIEDGKTNNYEVFVARRIMNNERAITLFVGRYKDGEETSDLYQYRYAYFIVFQASAVNSYDNFSNVVKNKIVFTFEDIDYGEIEIDGTGKSNETYYYNSSSDNNIVDETYKDSYNSAMSNVYADIDNSLNVTYELNSNILNVSNTKTSVNNKVFGATGKFIQFENFSWLKFEPQEGFLIEEITITVIPKNTTLSNVSRRYYLDYNDVFSYIGNAVQGAVYCDGTKFELIYDIEETDSNGKSLTIEDFLFLQFGVNESTEINDDNWNMDDNDSKKEGAIWLGLSKLLDKVSISYKVVSYFDVLMKQAKNVDVESYLKYKNYDAAEFNKNNYQSDLNLSTNKKENTWFDNTTLTQIYMKDISRTEGYESLYLFVNDKTKDDNIENFYDVTRPLVSGASGLNFSATDYTKISIFYNKIVGYILNGANSVFYLKLSDASGGKIDTAPISTINNTTDFNIDTEVTFEDIRKAFIESLGTTHSWNINKYALNKNTVTASYYSDPVEYTLKYGSYEETHYYDNAYQLETLQELKAAGYAYSEKQGYSFVGWVSNYSDAYLTSLKAITDTPHSDATVNPVVEFDSNYGYLFTDEKALAELIGSSWNFERSSKNVASYIQSKPSASFVQTDFYIDGGYLITDTSNSGSENYNFWGVKVKERTGDADSYDSEYFKDDNSGELILYPVWMANDYVLRFDLRDANVLDEDDKPYGSTQTLYRVNNVSYSNYLNNYNADLNNGFNFELVYQQGALFDKIKLTKTQNSEATGEYYVYVRYDTSEWYFSDSDSNRRVYYQDFFVDSEVNADRYGYSFIKWIIGDNEFDEPQTFNSDFYSKCKTDNISEIKVAFDYYGNPNQKPISDNKANKVVYRYGDCGEIFNLDLREKGTTYTNIATEYSGTKVYHYVTNRLTNDKFRIIDIVAVWEANKYEINEIKEAGTFVEDADNTSHNEAHHPSSGGKFFTFDAEYLDGAGNQIHDDSIIKYLSKIEGLYRFGYDFAGWTFAYDNMNDYVDTETETLNKNLIYEAERKYLANYYYENYWYEQLRDEDQSKATYVGLSNDLLKHYNYYKISSTTEQDLSKKITDILFWGNSKNEQLGDVDESETNDNHYVNLYSNWIPMLYSIRIDLNIPEGYEDIAHELFAGLFDDVTGVASVLGPNGKFDKGILSQADFKYDFNGILEFNYMLNNTTYKNKISNMSFVMFYGQELKDATLVLVEEDGTEITWFIEDLFVKLNNHDFIGWTLKKSDGNMASLTNAELLAKGDDYKTTFLNEDYLDKFTEKWYEVSNYGNVNFEGSDYNIYRDFIVDLDNDLLKERLYFEKDGVRYYLHTFDHDENRTSDGFDFKDDNLIIRKDGKDYYLNKYDDNDDIYYVYNANAEMYDENGKKVNPTVLENEKVVALAQVSHGYNIKLNNSKKYFTLIANWKEHDESKNKVITSTNENNASTGKIEDVEYNGKTNDYFVYYKIFYDKTMDVSIDENKTYFEYNEEDKIYVKVETPDVSKLSEYFELKYNNIFYEKTLDTSIDENKTYYEYNETDMIYVKVKTPDETKLGEYFELKHNNIFYVKTKDTSIDVNKSYYKYNETSKNYVKVTSPDISKLNEYFERRTNLVVRVKNSDGEYKDYSIIFSYNGTILTYDQNYLYYGEDRIVAYRENIEDAPILAFEIVSEKGVASYEEITTGDFKVEFIDLDIATKTLSYEEMKQMYHFMGLNQDSNNGLAGIIEITDGKKNTNDTFEIKPEEYISYEFFDYFEYNKDVIVSLMPYFNGRYLTEVAFEFKNIYLDEISNVNYSSVATKKRIDTRLVFDFFWDSKNRTIGIESVKMFRYDKSKPIYSIVMKEKYKLGGETPLDKTYYLDWWWNYAEAIDDENCVCYDKFMDFLKQQFSYSTQTGFISISDYAVYTDAAGNGMINKRNDINKVVLNLLGLKKEFNIATKYALQTFNYNVHNVLNQKYDNQIPNVGDNIILNGYSSETQLKEDIDYKSSNISSEYKFNEEDEEYPQYITIRTDLGNNKYNVPYGYFGYGYRKDTTYIGERPIDDADNLAIIESPYYGMRYVYLDELYYYRNSEKLYISPENSDKVNAADVDGEKDYTSPENKYLAQMSIMIGDPEKYAQSVLAHKELSTYNFSGLYFITDGHFAFKSLTAEDEFKYLNKDYEIYAYYNALTNASEIDFYIWDNEGGKYRPIQDDREGYSYHVIEKINEYYTVDKTTGAVSSTGATGGDGYTVFDFKEKGIDTVKFAEIFKTIQTFDYIADETLREEYKKEYIAYLKFVSQIFWFMAEGSAKLSVSVSGTTYDKESDMFKSGANSYALKYERDPNRMYYGAGLYRFRTNSKYEKVIDFNDDYTSLQIADLISYDPETEDISDYVIFNNYYIEYNDEYYPVEFYVDGDGKYNPYYKHNIINFKNYGNKVVIDSKDYYFDYETLTLFEPDKIGLPVTGMIFKVVNPVNSNYDISVVERENGYGLYAITLNSIPDSTITEWMPNKEFLFWASVSKEEFKKLTRYEAGGGTGYGRIYLVMLEKFLIEQNLVDKTILETKSAIVQMNEMLEQNKNDSTLFVSEVALYNKFIKQLKDELKKYTFDDLIASGVLINALKDSAEDLDDVIDQVELMFVVYFEFDLDEDNEKDYKLAVNVVQTFDILTLAEDLKVSLYAIQIYAEQKLEFKKDGSTLLLIDDENGNSPITEQIFEINGDSVHYYNLENGDEIRFATLSITAYNDLLDAEDKAAFVKKLIDEEMTDSTKDDIEIKNLSTYYDDSTNKYKNDMAMSSRMIAFYFDYHSGTRIVGLTILN